MIVCICANVSETELQEGIARGKTLEELNVCQNCRICGDEVKKLVAPTEFETK